MKKISEKLRFIAMHAFVLVLVAAPSLVVHAEEGIGGITGTIQSSTIGLDSSISNTLTGVSGITSNTGGTSGTVSGSCSGTTGKFCNPLGSGNDSLAGLLEKILNVVIQIGAVVVVFFYIYAGFKYVVARGDEAQIKTANKTLTWTTVGAMVILGAQVISTAIQGTVSQISSGN